MTLGHVLRSRLAALVLAVVGVGMFGASVFAETNDSMPVSVVIGVGTATPDPTVTPVPTNTPAPLTPASDGTPIPITKLPATGATTSTGDVRGPLMLLVAGGVLLTLGWKARTRAA